MLTTSQTDHTGVQTNTKIPNKSNVVGSNVAHTQLSIILLSPSDCNRKVMHVRLLSPLIKTGLHVFTHRALFFPLTQLNVSHVFGEGFFFFLMQHSATHCEHDTQRKSHGGCRCLKNVLRSQLITEINLTPPIMEMSSTAVNPQGK